MGAVKECEESLALSLIDNAELLQQIGAHTHVCGRCKRSVSCESGLCLGMVIFDEAEEGEDGGGGWGGQIKIKGGGHRQESTCCAKEDGSQSVLAGDCGEGGDASGLLLGGVMDKAVEGVTRTRILALAFRVDNNLPRRIHLEHVEDVIGVC